MTDFPPTGDVPIGGGGNAALCAAITTRHAGTDVPEVIKLNSPEYEKHKKGIVEFTHKKHSEDYAKKAPDLYKNGCGECHHDADNKPLSNLKTGDDVQRCIECHKKPSERPKGKGAPFFTSCMIYILIQVILLINFLWWRIAGRKL